MFQRPGFEGWSAPGFTAITAPDMDNMESVQYDVYFSMKKPKDIYKFIEKNHLDADTNNELLACMGVVKYDGFTNVIYSLAAFVILLIMFGSVSLIYNCFLNFRFRKNKTVRTSFIYRCNKKTAPQDCIF